MRTLCFFILLLAGIPGFAQTEAETTLVKVGQTVPEFSYKTPDGKTINMKDLRGKLVLINFFATWCGPCRQELPHIQNEIFDQYKNNPKFQLLIFGREHNDEEVQKFKAENKYTMPFYADPERKIYGLFASQFIPRVFLVSRNGKVLFNSVGFNEKEFGQLKELIANELKK
jgi:peroxiredoxin